MKKRRKKREEITERTTEKKPENKNEILKIKLLFCFYFSLVFK